MPQGYARAVADVLGTRGSTGCWDYGGPKEQQSGVDVVKWLADRKWSNGKVAMIGGSYNGTTASMVAARGADVPELKAIVPIAGDQPVVRLRLRQRRPLLPELRRCRPTRASTPRSRFDFGFAKTVAADPMGQTLRRHDRATRPPSAARSSTPRRATTATPTTTGSGGSATTARTPVTSARRCCWRTAGRTTTSSRRRAPSSSGGSRSTDPRPARSRVSRSRSCT